MLFHPPGASVSSLNSLSDALRPSIEGPSRTSSLSLSTAHLHIGPRPDCWEQSRNGKARHCAAHHPDAVSTLPSDHSTQEDWHLLCPSCQPTRQVRVGTKAVSICHTGANFLLLWLILKLSCRSLLRNSACHLLQEVFLDLHSP